MTSFRTPALILSLLIIACSNEPAAPPQRGPSDNGDGDSGDGDGDGDGDDGDGDSGDGDGDVGDGDADDGGTGDGDEEPKGPPPKCVHEESQVVMMGDSYITWLSHSFPEDIKKESGQTWRNYAQGGFSMATGGLGSLLGLYIPNQIDTALSENPDFHTVLMDGGGNDVLVGWAENLEIEMCKDTGSSMLPVCQNLVTKALSAAEGLMDKAITAGVRDVVYFFYPHVPEGRPIGGPHPNEMLDYALPMVRDFCEGREEASGGALRCHFVDMVPVFKDHNPEWFNDDIHPNTMGSAAMAKELWSRMKELCIAQKEDSGCCEP